MQIVTSVSAAEGTAETLQENRETSRAEDRLLRDSSSRYNVWCSHPGNTGTVGCSEVTLWDSRAGEGSRWWETEAGPSPSAFSKDLSSKVSVQGEKKKGISETLVKNQTKPNKQKEKKPPNQRFLIYEKFKFSHPSALTRRYD